MKLLLDTSVLIWTFAASQRLSERARLIATDPNNDVWFSVVSLWEVGVKFALGRASFNFDPRTMRLTMLDSGYRELTLTGEHALGAADLPPIHKDPFDRMLLSQATSEDLTFMTSDKLLTKYPGHVLLV